MLFPAEFASPIWTSGLSKDEANQIERIQKCAFSIILDGRYTSYKKALMLLNKPSLSSRRTAINLSFAKNCQKNEKYQNWFITNNPSEIRNKTRSENTILLPVQARTGSYLKSPIAYLTQLLNDES